MRISAIMILTLFLVGCESSQKSARLTADQAATLAMQLANDKANQLFHRRPFQNCLPAYFTAGHWIWTCSQGVNLEDFQARVELAANGSTNSVDIKLLDDALRPMPTERVR
jgi:hypothetical protein